MFKEREKLCCMTGSMYFLEHLYTYIRGKNIKTNNIQILNIQIINKIFLQQFQRVRVNYTSNCNLLGKIKCMTFSFYFDSILLRK